MDRIYVVLKGWISKVVDKYVFDIGEAYQFIHLKVFTFKSVCANATCVPLLLLFYKLFASCIYLCLNNTQLQRLKAIAF